jgi:hypothetical protein
MDDQPAQPGEFAQQLANLENFRPAIGEVAYQSAYTALIQQRSAARRLRSPATIWLGVSRTKPRSAASAVVRVSDVVHQEPYQVAEKERQHKQAREAAYLRIKMNSLSSKLSTWL